MAALTHGVQRSFLPGMPAQRFGIYLAANTTVHPGAALCVDPATGLGVNARSGAAADAQLRAAGVFTDGLTVTSTAAGETLVNLIRRPFAFASNTAAGETVGKEQLLTHVYFLDNNTITRTDGAGTRPGAGRVVQVTPEGIYVDMMDLP